MIFLLNSIYEIGKLYSENEKLDELDILLDVLDDKKIKDVLLINLVEDENGRYNYNKIITEDFDYKKNKKYIYKKGSSNGADISLSSLITTPRKTFNKKFLKWFDKTKTNDKLYNKIKNCIMNNKDEIFLELEENYNNLNVKKTNTLLTILITDSEGMEKYIGDYDFFINQLKNDSREKFYKQKSKKIKGDGNCLLCGEDKEVFGLVSNNVGFKFSTNDKPGNISNGEIENQWKMIPICGDCAAYLEAGKKFIEKYLDFSEYGTKYQVIPNFIINPEENFNKIYNKLSNFKNENSEDIYKLEEKLQFLIKNIDDILEFKFLFYEKDKNVFNILAYVESISPSWLTTLYSAQFEISQFDFFNEDNLKQIFGEKTEGNIIDLINKNNSICKNEKWYQKFLSDFFYSFSEKIYLDLVVDVLSQKKLDYNFLLSHFMKKIQSNWKNKEMKSLKINVLKALMLIILFNKIKLFKGENIMNFENDLKIEELLNSPTKKACFYMGVLTKRLMNIQYSKLDSTPFYNKLYGLNLDYKKLKKIYPQIINKLEEYNAPYLNLKEKISINLLNSENDSELKKDEISYYFTLGFTLYNHFKNENKANNNEGEINE